MARREDNFPCGIRIIFDSITYYLLHYWEFYLSREDVRPIPQGQLILRSEKGGRKRLYPLNLQGNRIPSSVPMIHWKSPISGFKMPR